MIVGLQTKIVFGVILCVSVHQLNAVSHLCFMHCNRALTHLLMSLFSALSHPDPGTAHVPPLVIYA